MAGGKASARQKMINLMYLVFIAMMAMNMSKEVLNAFGLMDTKFSVSSTAVNERNIEKLELLQQKGIEQKADFGLSAERGKIVKEKSEKFSNYLQDLKAYLIKKGKIKIDPKTNELNWGTMDNSAAVDESWFSGDRLSRSTSVYGEFSGESVMTAFETYRNDIKEIFGKDTYFKPAMVEFENRFGTEDQISEEGEPVNWLKHNFETYPLVATYTRLSSIINDVATTESSLLNLLLGNANEEAYGLDKNKAIVLADKSTFFAGEKFQGKVVIGQYAQVPPIKLFVQGQQLDLSEAIDDSGAARLNFDVGSVGEHEIVGVFTVMQKGEPLEIPITGNYVVVPRPNDASIAADKMNVVYRGLDNPLTISIAGISSDKVSVTGPGISKVSNGRYVVVPPSDGKNTINITATGTLQGGDQIISTKKFRVKNIPKTLGRISGQTGSVSLNKRDLSVSRVEAYFSDFAYDLPVSVVSFDVTISGQPTITVRGNRLSQDAKDAISRAKRRSTVTIDRIQVEVPGVAVTLSKATPLIIKLTN